MDEILQKFPQPPQKVVSLVPSMTESIVDLGAGVSLAGITDFCVHPREALLNIRRVGGSRSPRLADIQALKPDLVLANQEENSRQVVEALRGAGVEVWLTFPKTVRETLDILFLLARLFQIERGMAKLETLERAVEWAEADLHIRKRIRYFCPIWRHQDSDSTEWWMTFNGNTYASDVLRLLGGENIFAARERHYPLAEDLADLPGIDPGSRDTRYPRVTLDEIRSNQPEVIILPDEPYPFSSSDQEDFLRGSVGIDRDRPPRVQMVDGSLVFWHGTRLALALNQLGDLFDQPES